MQSFATLLEQLTLTHSRNAKIRLLNDYLRSTPDPSRGWALAAITGGIAIPSLKAGSLRELARKRFDPVLFDLSYAYIGDLAETISLMWPQTERPDAAPELSEIVETLKGTSRTEGLRCTEAWLNALNPSGRWALLKLITGSLRIGLSARLARQALADFGQVEATDIEEIWHSLAPPYIGLFAWLEGREPKPSSAARAPFRPPMLAHPLVDKAARIAGDEHTLTSISPDIFAAEWKWDGVRVQLVSDGGVRRLYTRSGDDISTAFPEITEGAHFNAALDGELLVRAPGGGIAPFNELQKRLNRKTVSVREMAARPALLRAYDILYEDGADLRRLPFVERRRRLERFVVSSSHAHMDISVLIPFDGSTALEELRAQPPVREIEGLMLKRWDSPYIAGRPSGQWYKWKRDPFLIDAVLMYAQRGHGRRSGLYSDFTFGLWRGTASPEELTPVGKAYFGFTDEELRRLDRYVRENEQERFGPVRSVIATPDKGLVLEIAFEGVQRSPRHRSGLAMRFPRIHRVRWDKPPHEADQLDTLSGMLND
jgi:DNA ligase-1